MRARNNRRREMESLKLQISEITIFHESNLHDSTEISKKISDTQKQIDSVNDQMVMLTSSYRSIDEMRSLTKESQALIDQTRLLLESEMIDLIRSNSDLLKIWDQKNQQVAYGAERLRQVRERLGELEEEEKREEEKEEEERREFVDGEKEKKSMDEERKKRLSKSIADVERERMESEKREMEKMERERMEREGIFIPLVPASLPSTSLTSSFSLSSSSLFASEPSTPPPSSVHTPASGVSISYTSPFPSSLSSASPYLTPGVRGKGSEKRDWKDEERGISDVAIKRVVRMRREIERMKEEEDRFLSVIKEILNRIEKIKSGKLSRPRAQGQNKETGAVEGDSEKYEKEKKMDLLDKTMMELKHIPLLSSSSGRKDGEEEEEERGGEGMVDWATRHALSVILVESLMEICILHKLNLSPLSSQGIMDSQRLSVTPSQTPSKSPRRKLFGLF